MPYRLANLASYAQATCIEENKGQAIVHVGRERKKISLNESIIKNYSVGDILRIDGELALVIMKNPPADFLLLIGSIKKEVSLLGNSFVPFDPAREDKLIDSGLSKTSPPEWHVSSQLSKAERRKRAAHYQEEYGIEQIHSFNVVDGKMTLSEAIEIKKRKEKRRAVNEFVKKGISQDIINSYFADNITYEDVLQFQLDRDKNPDLVGSTEDIYNSGMLVPGSIGTGKRR